MLHRTFTLVSLAIVVGSAPLSAQSPSARRTHVAIAGGFEPWTVWTPRSTTLFGTLAIERRSRVSGLGLRLEALAGGDVEESTMRPQPACDGCLASRRRRDYALTLSGTYTLGRGSFRPYVISGIGLYSLNTYIRQNYTCSFNFPDRGCQRRPNTFRYNAGGSSLGLNAGAGVEYRFGHATLFGELRYHVADQFNRRSLKPAVLGIRF